MVDQAVPAPQVQSPQSMHAQRKTLAQFNAIREQYKGQSLDFCLTMLVNRALGIASMGERRRRCESEEKERQRMRELQHMLLSYNPHAKKWEQVTCAFDVEDWGTRGEIIGQMATARIGRDSWKTFVVVQKVEMEFDDVPEDFAEDTELLDALGLFEEPPEPEYHDLVKDLGMGTED